MGVTVVTVTVTRELVPLLHVEYNIIGVLASTYYSFLCIKSIFTPAVGYRAVSGIP